MFETSWKAINSMSVSNRHFYTTRRTHSKAIGYQFGRSNIDDFYLKYNTNAQVLTCYHAPWKFQQFSGTVYVLLHVGRIRGVADQIGDSKHEGTVSIQHAISPRT